MPAEETGASHEEVDDPGVLMDFTSSFKNTNAEGKPPAAVVKPWLRRKKRTGSAATVSSGEISLEPDTTPAAPEAKPKAKAAATKRSNRFWPSSASKKHSDSEKGGEKENQEGAEPSRDLFAPTASPAVAAPVRAAPAASSITFSSSSSSSSSIDGEDAVIGGLNAKLDALGFPQLSLAEPASIVQVVQTVLEELRQSSDMTQSYESTSHDAQIDCKRLQNEKEALKLQVLCLRQDLAALENRARIAADQHAKDKQRSDAWVKELQVSIAKMEGQQKAWQAALNRKETEYDRMQKRMQMLQTQRDRTVKRALEMDSAPTKGGIRPLLGSPGSWETTADGTAAADPDAVREDAEAAAAQSLAVLEEAAETSRGRRVAYLINENQKLRASLHSMQNLLMTKLQAVSSLRPRTPGQNGGDAASKDGSASGVAADSGALEIETLRLADSSFDLPADQLERRLAAVQDQTVAFLEAQEARAAASTSGHREDHVPTEAELKENLDQAKTLIQDLDACLRATLLCQNDDCEVDGSLGAAAGEEPAARTELDHEVAALRAKQYFEQEEADLRRARERLEQDRAMLHEEARKLDEERTKLDRRFFAQNAGITPSPDVTKGVHTPSLLERLSTPDPHAGATARKTLRFAELGVAPTPATRKLLDEIL